MIRLTTLLILVTFLIGCKKEDTVWDTDWSAPLINDTLSLSNLVNDSTLEISGGYYLVNLSRTINDINIGDVVKIENDTIEEVFVFSGSLNLSPGFSFVNSVEEHDMALESIELKEVLMREGFIDVRVENPLPTTTIFNVELPGVKKNGITFLGQYAAPPGSQSNPGVIETTIDLSGYHFDLTGATGGQSNLIRSNITVSTDPNGPSVTITPQDITKVRAIFRDVVIDYARGYFGNEVIIDTTVVNLDFLNSVASGMIDIPNTQISFEIVNGIKVGAQVSVLEAKNTNYQGNELNLTGLPIGASYFIDPATGSWNSLNPSSKLISFTSANSNIEQYIENLGSKHVFVTRMQLNPWGNVSGSYDEVFPNSRLSLRMHAQMPLMIGLDDLVLRDTFDLSLNQDPSKTHVKSGELILKARNGFPINGHVKIYLLNQNDAPLSTIIGSENLKTSLLGSLDANHNIYISDSEIHFVLTEDAISQINDVKKIVVETGFNTLNPSTNINEQMSIPEGAFLGIKLKSKFVTENRF